MRPICRAVSPRSYSSGRPKPSPRIRRSVIATVARSLTSEAISVLPTKYRVAMSSKCSAWSASGNTAMCVATVTRPASPHSQSAGTCCSAVAANGSPPAPLAMN